MALGVAEIERWDPEAVREVFHAAGARATSSNQAALALAELPTFATWGGVAAAAAREAIGKTRVDLDADAHEARAVAQAAEQAAQDIEKIKVDLRRLEDEAHAAKLAIDAATSRVLPTPGFTGTAAESAAAVTALQGRLNALLAEADAVDAELAAAIHMADGAARIPDAAPAPAPPAPSTRARDVNRWWNTLTPDQQHAELRDHPSGIGNLNGVPVSARSEANLRVLRHDLEAVAEAAHRAGVGTEDVVADPGRYGLTATDITRYRNAAQTRTGLDHDSGFRGNPTYLLAYDPTAFGGKGRAAIAIGDPDTAKNTSVIVPGTGSSVRSGWLSDRHDDALHLFEQSMYADPTNANSVIAWMGYDAPNGFDDPRIATPWLARGGAQSLALDVDALAATHLGGSGHLTVLGHSYGSTTVADAATLGMPATDVVLLGCPGTDLAHSTSDFHLAAGGAVYVGDASTDPVGWLGVSPAADIAANAALGSPLGPVPGLGIDPAAQGFGAVRIAAEVPNSDALSFADHSHYYARGSESLRAMTDIAIQHSDQLAADQVLAPGRRQPVVSTPDHIDLPWGQRLDIPHADIPIPGTPEVIDPEWDRPGNTVTDNHGYQ